MTSPTTASGLLQLLANRHSTDVFVAECKDGPSQYASHRRMDAWAMPRSWSKPWVHAYEIKVSRADFLKDDKWPDYLPLCNCFWFVAPPNTIQPDELPPEAGLLVATKTGSRLLAKKKAPIRQVKIPESVFRYILMCRSKIGEELRATSVVERWQHWLAQKSENQRVGYEVSTRIRKIHERLRRENEKLKAEMQALDDFREDLARVGIEPGELVASWSRRRRLADLTGERAIEDVRNAVSAMNRALEQFDRAIPAPLDHSAIIG